MITCVTEKLLLSIMSRLRNLLALSYFYISIGEVLIISKNKDNKLKAEFSHVKYHCTKSLHFSFMKTDGLLWGTLESNAMMLLLSGPQPREESVWTAFMQLSWHI